MVVCSIDSTDSRVGVVLSLETTAVQCRYKKSPGGKERRKSSGQDVHNCRLRRVLSTAGSIKTWPEKFRAFLRQHVHCTAAHGPLGRNRDRGGVTIVQCPVPSVKAAPRHAIKRGT